MNQMTEWLFDAPTLVLAPLALAAVMSVGFGLLRGDRRVGRIGLIAVGVLIVWGAMSYLVQTPVEAALARTRRLAADFDAQDWPAFGKLIDPETRFYGRLKGQQITEAARLTHDATGASGVSVLSARATRDGEAISVTMRVLSRHDRAQLRSVVTLFRFDFHRRGGQWKLEAIEPLPTESFDAPAYLRFLVMPPTAQSP